MLGLSIGSISAVHNQGNCDQSALRSSNLPWDRAACPEIEQLAKSEEGELFVAFLKIESSITSETLAQYVFMILTQVFPENQDLR